VSEFANVILAGAKVISGEALLCANLGFGARLISEVDHVRHLGLIVFSACSHAGIVNVCLHVRSLFSDLRDHGRTASRWRHGKDHS
jgi:hypothetical protein